jgi:hypothetical protein
MTLHLLFKRIFPCSEADQSFESLGYDGLVNKRGQASCSRVCTIVEALKYFFSVPFKGFGCKQRSGSNKSLKTI